jgi:hypothetical protein
MTRFAVVFGIASALWVAVGGSAFAQDTQKETRYAGEWTGKYVCGQGVTAIRLVVVPTGAGGAKAVAHFFPTPENPRVPEGCFALTGLFDQVSGEFGLRQANWIVRPRGYTMIDLVGTVDAKGTAFGGGRITSLKGCSTFSLTRETVSMSMPPQCLAAAQ